MWKIKGKDLQMNCGDFGIALPISITNVLETDTLKFQIYDTTENNVVNKNLIMENGKWIFELTKEESDLLKEKTYMYKIVQYRDSILQNTINENSLFEVV